MKTAVLIIAYNEAEWIEKCIKQFKGLDILVLVSTLPWNGSPCEDDGTADTARRSGAKVIIQHWQTEAEQRNWGLAYLYEYDYVFIVDADEFYRRQDIEFMLKLAEETKEPCYRIKEMKTYWKTTDYRFEPPDKHQPAVLVDPKRIKFHKNRELSPVEETKQQQWIPVIDRTMYHMSWVKSDEKVKEKIQSFSHSNEIRYNWYEDVWLNWTEQTENIRPYGKEVSKAIKDPIPKDLLCNTTS